MEFSIIELLNPLKSVRHCKLLKRQISRVVTLLNSSVIVVAHNIDITIYEAKITSIEDHLKGYSKPSLMGIEPPTSRF